MTGTTLAGMLKPFWASQLSRALESVECSCTVAYGPTFSAFVTVTAGGADVPFEAPAGSPAAKFP